jgi:phage baseplate assembly protein W
VRLVAEAIYRLLITRKGQLLGSPDYGLRIADYLGTDTTTGEAKKFESMIRQEVVKDGRVDSADVTITEVVEGAERHWTVKVDAYTGAGPFKLVLAVDGVSTTLLEIS